MGEVAGLTFLDRTRLPLGRPPGPQPLDHPGGHEIQGDERRGKDTKRTMLTMTGAGYAGRAPLMAGR